MTICRPCAEAADAETKQLRESGAPPIGHPPEICRDHDVQPHGCACQHRPQTGVVEVAA